MIRQGQCVRRGAKIFLFSTAAMAALPAPPARAAQWTWTGGSGADNSWQNPQNWSPATAPVSAASTDLTFAGTTLLTPVHGAFTLNSMTFAPGAGAFDVQSDGPLTFVADDTQPAINNLSAPNVNVAVRGDLVIPPGVSLALNAGDAPRAGSLQVGNPPSPTGGSRFGGATGRGGALELSGDNPVVIFDNSRTTPGNRGLELVVIRAPAGGLLRVGNSSFTGSGISVDVPTIEVPQGRGFFFVFAQDGVPGNRFGFGNTTITGGSENIFVIGDMGAAATPRVGVAAPRVTVTGTLSVPDGSLAAVGNVLFDRDGNAPTVVYDAGIRTGGTTGDMVWFGSHDPDPNHTLQFGSDANDTIIVGPRFSGPSKGVFDNTLGATGQVSAKRLVVKSDVQIEAGSSVDIRNSATVTSGGGMEFEGSFLANGTATNAATLFLNVGAGGPGGVTFGPNTRLRSAIGFPANAAWFRVQGTASNIANLLTPARVSTNTLGFITIAPTDAPFNLAGSLPPTTGLDVVNSNPNGTDVRINAAGGSITSSEIRVSPGATLDAANNVLSGVVRGTGTILGPVTLGGSVQPGSVDPAVVIGGKLNTGEVTLTDPATLRVRFGNSFGYTGLHASGDVVLEPAATPGPLSGPLLDVLADSTFAMTRGGQSFPIVSVDAGFTLTGQFQGMPEGFFIATPAGSQNGFTIHYNVDGGDGSANDVVLTAVPEPGTVALMVMSVVGTLRRRRRLGVRT